MNKYCRICIVAEGKIEIFSEMTEKQTLSSLIMNCAAVKIQMNDGLPKLICENCMKNLNVSYNFKRQCEESDKKLREMFTDNNGSELTSNESLVFKITKKNTETDMKKCQANELILAPEPKSSSESDSENVWNEDLDFNKECVNNVVNSTQNFDEHILIKHDNRTLNSLSENLANQRKNNKKGVKLQKTRKRSLTGCSVINNKDKQTFVCEICSKSYGSRRQIRRHQITHEIKKQYSCNICDKQFHYKGNLQVHQRIHTGERPFLCNTCGKSFIQVAGLQRHLTIHTDEKPFVCNICSKRFKLADSLTCHLRTHTMERPYQCQKCGKSFGHQSGLNKHIRVHTGEKNYQCKQCGKLFSRSDSLAEHVKIHTGERPHRCSTCGSAFSSRSTLKVHIRTHTFEKPYKCHLCEKSFTQSSVLGRHLRTHTGERPFTCTLCGLSFPLKVRLIKHMHKIHNNDNEKNQNSCINSAISSNVNNDANYCNDLVPDQQYEQLQNYNTNSVLLVSNINSSNNVDCNSISNNNNNCNGIPVLSNNSINVNIHAQNDYLRYVESMKINQYYVNTVVNHKL